MIVTRTLTITDSTYLAVYPYHNSSNQLFKIPRISDQRYQLVNRTRCVEYDSYNDVYVYVECDITDKQMFTVLRNDDTSGDESYQLYGTRVINNMRFNRKTVSNKHINEMFVIS
jgi:hypothetical protein